jgi:hypothetical protein
MNALDAQGKQWFDIYGEIQKLVAGTSDIVIENDKLSFYDDEAKKSFHRMLDGMLYALASDVLAEEDAIESHTIDGFSQVEASLCEKSGINTVILPRSLMDYRSDPVKTAAKVLFDPGIRLLQQQITPEGLVLQAKKSVPTYLAKIDRYLYEAWIAYGLLDLLDPVEFWNVDRLPDGSFISKPADHLETGLQPSLKDYRLPEALFRTASGACYAYKFDHVTEIASYKTPARAKDFTSAGNTVGQVCQRALLLFELEDLDTVPIIAQRSKKAMLKPALVVEHLSAFEYGLLERRQEVRARAEIMNTDAPTRLVLLQEQPEVDLEASELGARAFSVSVIGHDRDLLAQLLVPEFITETYNH